MVRCVCTSDDVKHNRMSRKLYPSSRMTTKSKESFGLWRSLDFVFALLLLLQCFSAATTTVTTAGATTSAADRTPTTNTSAATAVTAGTVTATETKGTATTAARTTTTETDTTAKNTRSATITIAQNATTTTAAQNPTTTQNAMSATTTANVTTTQNAMSATTTANVTTTQNATTTATPAIATITVNTTILNTSINIPEMTTALPTTPMPCSFDLSCNQTFYWMAISVQGLFPNANQSKVVEAWLKPVFQNNLSGCVDANVSKFRSSSTSASTKTPGPFLDMSVSCEPQLVTMEELCDVLLNLSRPVDVCCIKTTLIKAGNVTINGTFIGGVERVGVCLDNTTNSTSRPYNECNNSNSDHQCSGNWICVNNTIQKNCTIIPPTSSENSCNCSSTCNSSDAYYRLTVDNVTMNKSTLESFIDQWLKNISYKRINLECSGTMYTLQNCTAIVRLNTGHVFDVCRVFKYHNVSLAVNRVAVCSRSSDDSYKRNITWIQHPVSFEDFCRNNSLVNCSSGSSVGVLLNDSCNSNVTFINGTSPTPSSTTPPSSIDAGELLNMTENASSLNFSQVDSIITKLERLLSGPNVSVALANTSVGIVNNLLDVPVAVMEPFSKRANGIVDTLGLKLVVSGESETLLTSSLALAVKKVDGAKFQEISFSITDQSNVQIRSDSRLKRDVQVRSVPLGSAILPASLTQNLSSQEQQLASRVQFNFYQKSTFFQDKALGNHSLISGILSASVANLTIFGLDKNVTITLQHTETPDNRAVSCAFWNLSLNGDTGGWSTEGCTKVNSSSSQEKTQCSCNHLTSFGILLDLSKQPIDPLQNTILTYITHIGCGISSIFLSITLLTYLAFSKLRNDIPSKILIQLCLALLMLNLVFLVDGWLAQFRDERLCTSTAFFLHYFLLASFTWMAMEAVHMYIALVKVFNTYISRFMLKIGFAGWGIPLIVVIIVIATDHIPTNHNYGHVPYSKFVDGTPDDFCWITNNTVFYVAVVGYFCIVFLINFTMFIVVLIQLCRIKRQNPQNVQNRSSWQEIRSVAGLTVLLGLTWGFAFFAWGPVNLPFMYLFAIFNSLQGLFIFIYHCALKENVRRQWRTYLCCGKMRLPENSEWSLTATQKNKKVSKKRPSSAQSNNSRLSFLNNDSTASDLPMGISNPYDDRIITASEERSSDVVLNEINNKHRGKKSY